jgi:hypothetical protein
MARTEVSHQQIVPTGLEQTYASAHTDGNKFSNDGHMFLHVKNGAGAPINVTIQTAALYEGLAVADVVVAVTNGEERMIGPFPVNIYNQVDGMVYVDYSSVTTITVAVLRM